MRTLGALLIGMGLGYMSMEHMFFIVPMIFGLFFVVCDIIIERGHKLK